MTKHSRNVPSLASHCDRVRRRCPASLERPFTRHAIAKTHRLEATPSTVAYGWDDAAGAPVLTIASGDIIDVDTLLTNTPTGLAAPACPTTRSRRR